VIAPLATTGRDFGDAFDFMLHERTGPRGAQVGGSQLLGLIVTHLELSAAAVGIAIAVAIPLGLWLGHTRRGSFVAVTVANVGRAVPSIGLVFLFFAILGAGFVNIMLALVLLAIPPILTNTYTGMREVDPGVVDAARGMGMTGRRIVRKVELPLALPLVFGGIRISSVSVIAAATLGPVGGVVTLGDPLINPSCYGDAGRLGAASVVAALAVAAEVGLSAVQRAATPRGSKVGGRRARPQGRFIPKRRAQPAP